MVVSSVSDDSESVSSLDEIEIDSYIFIAANISSKVAPIFLTASPSASL